MTPIRIICTLAVITALPLSVSTAPADELQLISGNASFNYDSDSPAGGNADLVSTVTGDTLFQETWFLRYNDPLFGLTTAELANGTANANGNQGTLSFIGIGAGFGGGGFDVVLDYTVFDFFGHPTLDYSASITNNNNDTEDVILYHYFDHDLNGAGSDSATFSAGAPHDEIAISDAGGLEIFRQFDPVEHFQIEAWSNDLDGDIRDAVITELADTGSPFGPGDFTAALQWDLTIDAGQTATVHGHVVVPEPASLSLLAILGLAGLIRRRPRVG